MTVDLDDTTSAAVPRSTDRATCVFAVCRPADPTAFAGAAGHAGGAPVRLMPVGSLYAVVQDVPAAEFSEEALRERLADREELERCARAHHAVVTAAARCGATVPLPLATLYLGDESARSTIAGDEGRFHAVLDRIEGHVEWAVKVHTVQAPAADRAEPGGRAGLSPGAPAAAAAQGAAAHVRAKPSQGAGRAYLSRVRGQQQAREDRQDAALGAAELVDRAMRGVAVAALRRRLHSPEHTGPGRVQVMNAAYLVADGRGRELADVIGRLRRTREFQGIEIDVSGPWAPYSFTDGGDFEAAQ